MTVKSETILLALSRSSPRERKPRRVKSARRESIMFFWTPRSGKIASPERSALRNTMPFASAALGEDVSTAAP